MIHVMQEHKFLPWRWEFLRQFPRALKFLESLHIYQSQLRVVSANGGFIVSQLLRLEPWTKKQSRWSKDCLQVPRPLFCFDFEALDLDRKSCPDSAVMQSAQLQQKKEINLCDV
jgi:hypothetical protein